MLISYCHWTLHCFAASGGSFGPLPGRQIQPFSVIQGAKKMQWIFPWIFFSGASKNSGKTRVFETWAIVLQNRHSPIQIRSSPSRVLSLSVTGLFFAAERFSPGTGLSFALCPSLFAGTALVFAWPTRERRSFPACLCRVRENKW